MMLYRRKLKTDHKLAVAYVAEVHLPIPISSDPCSEILAAKICFSYSQNFAQDL